MSAALARASQYRSLLRELSKQTKQASKRQKAVSDARMLLKRRSEPSTFIASEPAPPPAPHAPHGVAAIARTLPAETVHEVHEFLRNQREYKELLQRYQGGDVDSVERVKLSAKRVGLEVPE